MQTPAKNQSNLNHFGAVEDHGCGSSFHEDTSVHRHGRRRASSGRFLVCSRLFLLAAASAAQRQHFNLQENLLHALLSPRAPLA